METFSTISLGLGVLFLVLWYFTPTGSRYETVEGDIVATRKVWLVLAVVSLGFWLGIETGYFG